MKKLFAFFLAFALFCLSACNIAPPAGTSGNGGVQGTPNTPSGENWQDAVKDRIVSSSLSHLIDLPSRVIFGNPAGSRTYYYSKVDGKAYDYCFDPLCDHTDYTCLANPGGLFASFETGWTFNSTFFINGRFYSTTMFGQIWSFAFDGSDKRIEYDAGYDLEEIFQNGPRTNIWSTPAIVYGPYIYINVEQIVHGDPHILRFNVETKEMEDLTEKTGNFIYPHYFYNGMIYGNGDYAKTGDAFLKADLDLRTVEVQETAFYADAYAGTVLVGPVYKERESIEEIPEQIGLFFYDIKTGEQKVLTKEELGLEDYPFLVGATDEHFYFYIPTIVNIGTVINNQGKEWTVQKMNDGKLYRMDSDGTNIVCVYEDPDYELNYNMVISEDRILMTGKYITIEDGQKKTWGGMIQVAVINEDGTVGEFKEVEYVS